MNSDLTPSVIARVRIAINELKLANQNLSLIVVKITEAARKR